MIVHRKRKNKRNNKFDYTIYKIDGIDKPTNSEINNIVTLYKDFVSMNRNQRGKIDYNDKDNQDEEIKKLIG